MAIEIILPDSNERGPILCHYPAQTNPQGGIIELSEDGRVRAGYNPEVGNAVPFEVYHRRTLRWDITPNLSGGELRKILEDAGVVALLERVHAGHSVEWDGSNHVGVLTDDASEAYDDLERIFEEVEPDIAGLKIWDWSPDLSADDIRADLETVGGDYDALFREYERQAWEDVKVILYGDGNALRQCVEEHEEEEEADALGED